MRLNLLRHSRERGNPAFLYCCGRKLDPRFRGGDARWAVFIFLFFAVSAHAQNLVTSPRPDHVAVTVYRDPNRAAAQAPNLSFLNGYALISETRAVSLPAGESELRFEGVAGGILPQSAIVTGLGDGVIERNRDAWLLSPGTLIERSLGRRVHLRRTSRATGAVREEEAVVRSGADGALVLQTPAGFEALRCSGLAETVTYDGVPAGLAARPTLSVRVRAPQPMTATVTLSYLSSGFDWQANYVANLAEDGESIDLFAWLTIANTDETSFADADAQAVAGRLNRSNRRVQPAESRPIDLQCWPAGTTSDIPEDESLAEDIVVTGSRVMARNFAPGAPPPPPPPPPPAAEAAMQAQQEELGDLKLYRIPEPVTVAANSQKQVAFLTRPRVRVQFVYRQTIQPSFRASSAPARRIMITRNRPADGLGMPLPAGRIVLFDSRGGRPILIGEGSTADRAVNEDVEISLGEAPGVTASVRPVGNPKLSRAFELTVTNDQSAPVRFEASLAGGEVSRSSARLGRRDGRPLWSVTVPANGRAVLTYTLAPAA